MTMFLLDRRFLGSTLAIMVGVGFLGGDATAAILGPVMILGGFAYHSRKRRLLGLSTLTPARTLGRKSGEGLALAAILLVVIPQLDLIVASPMPNVIVIGWAVIAYFCAGIRSKPQQLQSKLRYSYRR